MLVLRTLRCSSRIYMIFPCYILYTIFFFFFSWRYSKPTTYKMAISGDAILVSSILFTSFYISSILRPLSHDGGINSHVCITNPPHFFFICPTSLLHLFATARASFEHWRQLQTFDAGIPNLCTLYMYVRLLNGWPCFNMHVIHISGFAPPP